MGDASPLAFHRRVNVIVHGHVDAGMTEDFTERFYVVFKFYPTRCEGVTEGMEIYLADAAGSQRLFETIGKGSRLHRAGCVSRKNVGVVREFSLG